MKPHIKQASGSWIGRRLQVTDETGTRLVATCWSPSAISPDWRDTLRVGDVLRKGRSFRVVREALYRPNGEQLQSVTLAIQRCSRYRRCYTIYLRNDLKQAGYTKTGVRVRLEKDFDRELSRNIRNSEYRTLYCWDTVGVVP